MTQEQMVNEEPAEDHDHIPDLFDDKLSAMYMYEEEWAPGASMYYDEAVKVSDKMHN